MKRLFNHIKPIKAYLIGQKIISDPHYIDVEHKSETEIGKPVTRTEIINFLLNLQKGQTLYLELGVRNPEDNFNHIHADQKYSVDPGIEYRKNPVDFKLTSDEFFDKLSRREILSDSIQFDVIFIDGLHLAEQVDRDITNALKYVKEDGFVVLHDCNPPSEWHARENYEFQQTPAKGYWNGTTWKAFLKWRGDSSVFSACIDSDWGVGILSKKHEIGSAISPVNPFFEFSSLEKNRERYLNLVDFETFKSRILIQFGSRE